VVNNNSLSAAVGVQNVDTDLLDATFNWWGDASGPSGEGPGTGSAVSVNVDYDPWWAEAAMTTLEGSVFIRADANGDQKLNLADPVYVLQWLFFGGSVPACLDSADSNDDGTIDLADPIFSLSYQFRGGPSPLPPFPNAGVDLTPDVLDCLDP